MPSSRNLSRLNVPLHCFFNGTNNKSVSAFADTLSVSFYFSFLTFWSSD